MRKKIDGVLYDTATASLIVEMDSMTVFSGRMSVGLYKSQKGQWFQFINPAKGSTNPVITNWISPNTAKRWLEKHSFNLQHRVYFGDSDTRLKPERQVLVAEREPLTSTDSHNLGIVERLYHHPQKGWCLKQTKEPVLIPLTVHEVASVAKAQRVGKGHIQNPLPSMETYMYERGHLDHRRI